MAHRIQNVQQGNRAMAQRIESVHQGNPHLQERATLEKRRRVNLALEAIDAARAVEQAQVERLQRFGEACEAPANEDRETVASASAETTTERQRIDEVLALDLAERHASSLGRSKKRKELPKGS